MFLFIAKLFHVVALAAPLACNSEYSSSFHCTEDMLYSRVHCLAQCNEQTSLPAPGHNWNCHLQKPLVASHLHGPASINCHCGLPNPVWSIPCTLQGTNAQPKFTWAEQQLTDSWLAPLPSTSQILRKVEQTGVCILFIWLWCQETGIS